MAGGAADAIEAAGIKGKVFAVRADRLQGKRHRHQDGRIGFMVGVPPSSTPVESSSSSRICNGKPYPKKTIIPGQVFTAANISTKGALRWELQPSFLK